MKTISTVRAILTLLCTLTMMSFSLLLLTSCGAPKESTLISKQILKVVGERPPLDNDLATLVPAGLQAATWINLAAMRKSPLWPTLESVLETHYSNKFLSRQMVLQMLRSADEVLAVSGHRSEKESDGFVTLLKGKWDTAKMMTRLSATGNFKKTAVNSQEMLRISNIHIYPLTDKTIVIVTENLLKDVQKLAQLQGKSLRADKFFKDLNLPADGGSAARYVRGDSKLNTRQFSGLPSVYRRFAKDVKRADVLFLVSDNVFLMGNIKMEEKTQAELVKKTISKDLKAISSNVLIAMLGVKSLVRKLKLSTKAEQVEIALGLTPNDVKKIIQLLEPIMQIRKML